MKSLWFLLLAVLFRSLLVLAVVLWIFSQNTGLVAEGDLNRWSCSVVVCPSGYLSGISDPLGLMWEYSVVPASVAKEGEWLFAPREFDLRRSQYHRPLPGVGIIQMPDRTLCAVRHPFVVCALFVLNLFLQIIKWRWRSSTQHVELRRQPVGS